MAKDSEGLARVKSMETNQHPQGRSGSGTQKNKGPVKNAPGNPTMGGGINRATKTPRAGVK